ncbi:MAG: glycosyltransferase family 1 protein [Actinobacteria bacterium]|nr:MAG: glycosyltransferase family 1 protein [Actinomycetota bacterium]
MAVVVSHVCLVTETYPPEINGVAATLAQLASGMRARGHTVSLVRPVQPAVDARGRRREPGTLLVAGMRLPGYKGLRLGFPAGAVLRAVWTRNRPDAVYVATEGPLGWSAVRAGAALGIPVYSGFHTNFDRYMQHYGAGWLRRPIAAYLRRFHNATAGTLVSTPRLRAELEAAGFERLGVLGRGVDGGRFDPARRSAKLRASWGVADGDLVVLYVGRLAPEKNVELAVEAYRAMQRACGGALRFVVVGDGPLGAALARAHPDLVFCGFRTGDELTAHYASADLFLFPSETETFGNVTLEAMASGLAVVAYDYAAARVHVENGVTGALARPGDARGFIDAAVALAVAPEALPAMRRRARAAMEAVDWSRVVGRFEQLLLGDAGREEDERAEQRALGGSGPVPHLRRRDRGEEARGLPLHAARSSADAGAAAEALPMGADASLLRRSVLPG